jgi:plasmid maintenance system antidote protein VapI
LPLRIYVNEPLPNIHPGEILFEEFLFPMNVSQNALARAAIKGQFKDIERIPA